ncbi:hypothetical protein MCP1_2450002 [Candidatus Terasakiella magnetica]|nr:hypothetical protein MCP1_2450002 [Candidatus Terasakiella magnetica]
MFESGHYTAANPFRKSPLRVKNRPDRCPLACPSL